MLVNQILKAKDTEGVVTLEPAATIAEAAQLLSEKRIGTVVASDDGETAQGILSERDIVREVGRRGASVLALSVGDLMTQKVVTCAMNDSAESVLTAMTEGRFRHMPVVEDGKLTGLITLGDVVKARLQELSMEKDALEGMIMGH